MTLIVETGAVVANANTYAAKATVDAYHLARRNSSWLPSSEDAEAAILRAMDWLESQPFKGQPCNIVGSSSGQPLQWPRFGVVLNGYQWDSDEIPPQLVKALCEAALIELAEPGALAPELERGGMVQSETVDVISTTYMSGAPSGTVYTALRQALRGLVRGGDSIELVRV